MIMDKQAEINLMQSKGKQCTVEIAASGVIYPQCTCLSWMHNPTRLVFLSKGKTIVTSAQVIIEEDYDLV